MRYVNKKTQDLLNLLKNKGLKYPDTSLYRAFSKKQKETDLESLNKDELENIYKEWRDFEAKTRKEHRMRKQKQKQEEEEAELYNYLIDEYEKEEAEKAERKSRQDENDAAMSLLNLNSANNNNEHIVQKHKENKTGHSVQKHKENKTGHSVQKHKEIVNRIKQNLPVTEEDMSNYEKYKKYHRDYARKSKKNYSQRHLNRYKSRKNSTKKKEPQINIQQNDIIPDHALIPKNISVNEYENENEEVNEYEISKDAPINHLNLPHDFQFDEKYDFGYVDSPSVGTLIDSNTNSSSVGTLIDSDEGSNKISNINFSSYDPENHGYLEPLPIDNNINLSSYQPENHGYLEPLPINNNNQDNKILEQEEHRKESVNKFRKRKQGQKKKEELTKKRKRYTSNIDSLQNLKQKRTMKNRK